MQFRHILFQKMGRGGLCFHNKFVGIMIYFYLCVINDSKGHFPLILVDFNYRCERPKSKRGQINLLACTKPWKCFICQHILSRSALTKIRNFGKIFAFVSTRIVGTAKIHFSEQCFQGSFKISIHIDNASVGCCFWHTMVLSANVSCAHKPGYQPTL